MSTTFIPLNAKTATIQFVGPGTVVGDGTITDHALLINGNDLVYVEGSRIDLLTFSMRLTRALTAKPTRPCGECQDDATDLSPLGRCAECERLAAEAAALEEEARA